MIIYIIDVCYKYGEKIAIIIKITKIHNVSTQLSFIRHCVFEVQLVAHKYRIVRVQWSVPGTHLQLPVTIIIDVIVPSSIESVLLSQQKLQESN